MDHSDIIHFIADINSDARAILGVSNYLADTAEPYLLHAVEVLTEDILRKGMKLSETLDVV